MFDLSWITTSGTAALMVIVKAVAIYAGLLFLARTAGLRSFAKMSSFDFAMTVAMGSLFASTLRQAGVTRRDQVLAVILETTGDVWCSRRRTMAAT